MQLLSATGLNEHCAVSVRPSGEHRTETDQWRGGDTDREFSTEYPQLELHAITVCPACSGSFINILRFGLGLGLAFRTATRYLY